MQMGLHSFPGFVYISNATGGCHPEGGLHQLFQELFKKTQIISRQRALREQFSTQGTINKVKATKIHRAAFKKRDFRVSKLFIQQVRGEH